MLRGEQFPEQPIGREYIFFLFLSPDMPKPRRQADYSCILQLGVDFPQNNL